MALQRLKQNRKVYEYVCANLVPFFENTPILVYQMGRGGSSSLRNSLMRCPADETTLVFHFHDFIPVRKMNPSQLSMEEAYLPYVQEEIRHAKQVYATFPLKQKICWFCRENLYAQSIYRNVIRSRRRAKIITLVREPIATNISMFFQLFERYTGVKYQDSQLTTPQLIEIFQSRYNFTRPLTWFDVEMKPAIGIDIYEYPFAAEKGYQVIRAGKLELLVLKAEIPDATKEQVIGEFVGIKEFELMRSNVSQKKAYAGQYQEFRETIRLAPAFVDQMYNSKFARHFYNETELNALRSYWLDRGKVGAGARVTV